MQVVLFHSVLAFLPGDGWWSATWARFVYDGFSAVWIFFLISGAVLTLSFGRDAPSVLAPAAKRVVRLFLPVAAAAVVAVLLLAAFPRAHLLAAEISGSAWLAMDSAGAATPGHLLREIGLDSLLLGYRESTLFPSLAPSLTPMTESLNAPFWSLHVELYGSFLVLALVALRMRSRRLHAAAVVALAIICPAQPLFLFVIGHLAARALHARAPALLGAVLLVVGIGLCADKDWIAVEWLRTLLGRIALVDPPNLYQFASQIGAIAVFAGVLLCPPVRALLATRPLQRLGALSFSIYLLHFPILFTLVSVTFVAMAALPHALTAAIAIAAEITLTLAAAIIFERWIDRPATALSRRVGTALRRTLPA